MQQDASWTDPVTNEVILYGGAPFGDVGSPNPDIAAGSAQGQTRGIVPFSGIPDGLSNTMLTSEVLVGQRGATYDLRGFSHWAYAANFSGYRVPNSREMDWMQSQGYCNTTSGMNPPCRGGINGRVFISARSKHPGGVNVGMADGSVKFIKDSVNKMTFRALSTTKGNEVVSSDAY